MSFKSCSSMGLQEPRISQRRKARPGKEGAPGRERRPESAGRDSNLPPARTPVFSRRRAAGPTRRPRNGPARARAVSPRSLLSAQHSRDFF